MAKVCFSCKKGLDITGTPGRGYTCPFCAADVKVCLNCRFYDESVYNRCTEPQAERVLEKGRANFCDYFEFVESTGKKAQEKTGDALEKLKGLFEDG